MRFPAALDLRIKKYAVPPRPRRSNIAVEVLITHGFDVFLLLTYRDCEDNLLKPAKPNPNYAQTGSYPHSYQAGVLFFD